MRGSLSTASVASGWSDSDLAQVSNRAGRVAGIGPTRPIGCASTADAMRSGCALSMLKMNEPPMHGP